MEQKSDLSDKNNVLVSLENRNQTDTFDNLNKYFTLGMF